MGFVPWLDEHCKNYINTTFSGNRQQNTILSEGQIKDKFQRKQNKTIGARHKKR